RPRSDGARAASDWLLENLLASGGWSKWQGQPEFDLDTSVLALLGLRLCGADAEDPRLQSARDAILNAGGAGSCQGLARYYLAVFGQLDWGCCPPLVPEMDWIPKWIRTSPANRSEWTRLLLAPLSILWSRRPRKIVREEYGVADLFDTEIRDCQTSLLERFLVGLNDLRFRPLRKIVLGNIDQWMVDRITRRDGMAGSFDATLVSIVGLTSQGYSRDSGPLADAIGCVRERIAKLANSKDAEGAAIQQSPVCDTAMSVRALAPLARESDELAVRRGIEWLLERAAQAESAEQGGWCREFENREYPGILSTSIVLLALREQFAERPPSSLVTDDSMVAMIRANSINLAHRQVAVLDRVAAASRRARQWVTSRQNYDGGWGHLQHLNASTNNACSKIFGNHCAADISTPAATGRVLQSLGAWEMGCGQHVVDRAVSFLRGLQLDDGSWAAFHDAGSIESTWSAIEGLRAVGLSRRDSTLADSARWLMDQQNEDGGWSESFGEKAVKVLPKLGASCPSVTAWAILGLMAAGHRQSDATLRGIDFLEQSRMPDGGWTATTPHRLNVMSGYWRVRSQISALSSSHIGCSP
ncbi:MAG: prenyltransferase/squalene oxidase repeat-containing protein, partial [Planctomycetota bacterium]